MKFNATIEIELPDDIANEWEPVAVRRAEAGDHFWSNTYGTVRCRDASGRDLYLILRRRFQWPAWLKCRFLVWGKSGCSVLLCLDTKPSVVNGCWYAHGASELVSTKYIDLPFPGGDWRTRIEENPNWKGDA